MKEMAPRRVLGVAITMMILLAVSVLPAMACPCKEGDKVVGNPGVGDLTELIGKEKSKILDMALESDRVKELQKQLVAEGFTQTDPEAFTVPVEVEDGLTTEVLVVAIPYEDDKSEVVKTVVYFHNPQTGESTTVVILGDLSDCVFNLLICLGTAAGCVLICAPLIAPDPAEPLEAKLCLACLPITVGACGLAYKACDEYYNG